MLRIHLAAACLLLSTTAAAQSSVDRVLVLVDGRPVLWSEVHRIVLRTQPDGLPASWHERRQLRASYRAALAKRILERRVIALAARQGVAVTEQDVEQALAVVAKQNDITVAELEKRVAEHGYTVAEYRTELRHQLLVYRLMARWREQQGHQSSNEPFSEQERRAWQRELRQAVRIEWPR
jgi:peptidyl-prolyl cis-trans isomerase SurA